MTLLQRHTLVAVGRVAGRDAVVAELHRLQPKLTGDQSIKAIQWATEHGMVEWSGETICLTSRGAQALHEAEQGA